MADSEPPPNPSREAAPDLADERALAVVSRGETRISRLLQRMQSLVAVRPRRAVALGERTLARLGHRRWGRPNVATSRRIFVRYGLQDPWDPNRTPGKDAIALGPVSLRLGDERRQPAPHLKPREPAKAKAASQAADPLAKWRRPKNTPKKPEPPPPPKRRPSATASMFSPEMTGRGVVGDLPMRPELKAALKANEGDVADAARSMARSQRSLPKVRQGAASGPPGRSRGGSKRKSARFSLRAAPASTGPVITEIVEPEPVIVEAPEPEPEAPPPPPRSVPGAGGGGGLDDLFGAAMGGGRLRIGRRKKGDDE